MIRLLSGDCRDVLPTLPADSVQCVVTSPPYYSLRDYQTGTWSGGDAACDHQQGAMRRDGYARPTAGPERGGTFNGGDKHFAHICGKCGAVRIDRQIGLEPTPDAYLATMVAVFREVKRVLRPDGTCWVNMGDSYNSNPGGANRTGLEVDRIAAGAHPVHGPGRAAGLGKVKTTDAKPKDLLLMPARLALALQADGWSVRQAITWCKSNPMPESAKDRCTSATEMVYMLTKRATYFYDAIAIAEPCVSDHPSCNGYKRDPRLSYGGRGNDEQWNGIGGTRNARNWWLINTEAFPSAHFATFPSALAERCIRAGTSERGACSACGKPWGRITERKLDNVPTRMATKRAPVDCEAMAAYLRERREALSLTRAAVDEALGTRTLYSWFEGRPAGIEPPTPEQWTKLKDVLSLDARFDEQIYGTVEVVITDHSPSKAAGVRTYAKAWNSETETTGWSPGCNHCMICDASQRPTSRECVATGVEPEAPAEPRNSRPPIYAEAETRSDLCAVREHIQDAAPDVKVMQSTLQGSLDVGERPRQSLHERRGGQVSAHSDQREDDTGAQAGDGAAPGSQTSPVGGRSPHQRYSQRQQNREPDSADGRAACQDPHEQATGHKLVPYPVVPCTILDPFAGAGTSLLVADRLQRDAIGIELSPDYTTMAMERCRADAPLFTSFPPAEDPEDERMRDLFAEAAE